MKATGLFLMIGVVLLASGCVLSQGGQDMSMMASSYPLTEPQWIRDGQPIELAGQGTRRQDYVDVRDVASAVAGQLPRRCSRDGAHSCRDAHAGIAVRRCGRAAGLRAGGVTGQEAGPRRRP